MMAECFRVSGCLLLVGRWSFAIYPQPPPGSPLYGPKVDFSVVSWTLGVSWYILGQLGKVLGCWGDREASPRIHFFQLPP